jgi:hypothetical protein
MVCSCLPGHGYRWRIAVSSSGAAGEQLVVIRRNFLGEGAQHLPRSALTYSFFLCLPRFIRQASHNAPINSQPSPIADARMSENVLIRSTVMAINRRLDASFPSSRTHGSARRHDRAGSNVRAGANQVPNVGIQADRGGHRVRRIQQLADPRHPFVRFGSLA